MPFHVRVLRRVLLLGSVLTLTGIHRDGASLPIGWRLSHLVSIPLNFVAFTLSLTNVAMLQQVHEALFSLSLSNAILLALLLLIWFIWSRQKCHHLLRQVQSLESGEDDLYRPGDTTPLYRQMALLATAIVALMTGGVVMRSIAELRCHHITVPMWLPEPLRSGAGFTLVFVLQGILAGMQTVELLTFILMVAGLVDAAALQLRLTQRALLSVCCPDASGETLNPTGVRSGQVDVTPARTEVGNETATQNKTKAERVAAWSDVETVDDLVSLSSPGDSDGTSAVFELRRQSKRYRLVHQLVSDTANAFSTPLLWLHAAVAVNLLAGYIAAVQLSGQVETTSYDSEVLCLAMVHWLAYLSIVADAGSRLIQQSEKLRDVVAKKCWSARMSAAARGELQVLLEQTRTQLALDVWGLFNVQKSVLLSVLSFVLTYFVIMLQMIR